MLGCDHAERNGAGSIAADGSVAAVKYGVHAYDQWSVDELLQLATSLG